MHDQQRDITSNAIEGVGEVNFVAALIENCHGTSGVPLETGGRHAWRQQQQASDKQNYQAYTCGQRTVWTTTNIEHGSPLTEEFYSIEVAYMFSLP